MPPGGVMPPDGIFLAGCFYLALVSEIYYKQRTGFLRTQPAAPLLSGPRFLF
jgi:hypothetical protein